MKLILPIILVVIAAVAVNAQSGIKSELVGVWQNSQGVASGLTDNYQFFDDGRFKFNYNEMDGTKRLISYSGFWNADRGKLHLQVNRMVVHIGGKWVKSTGSIATEYEIEGGKAVTIELKSVEKSSYRLEGPEKEDIYTRITIAGEYFWKLTNDPRGYEN